MISVKQPLKTAAALTHIHLFIILVFRKEQGRSAYHFHKTKSGICGYTTTNVTFQLDGFPRFQWSVTEQQRAENVNQSIKNGKVRKHYK